MDPLAAISQTLQPSSGAASASRAPARVPVTGPGTQPPGPSAPRPTDLGHQQPTPHATTRPVPPRRRNSKTQSQPRSQDQVQDDGSRKQDHHQSVALAQGQPSGRRLVSQPAVRQAASPPQAELQAASPPPQAGLQAASPPPQAELQSPPQPPHPRSPHHHQQAHARSLPQDQALSPPEPQQGHAEAEAQSDAGQEQQATQQGPTQSQQAQAQPPLNKSRSLSNAFGIGTPAFFRMASEDVAKAESIHNLRKSFASLFSD